MVRTSGSARQALTLAGRRRRRSGVQLSPGPPSTLKAKGTSSESVLEQESRDLRRIPDSSRCRVQLLSPVPPGIVPPVPCPPRSLPPSPAPSPRSRKVPQPGGSHPPKPQPTSYLQPAPVKAPAAASSNIPTAMPQGYSPALFPNPMFPSLSMMGSPPPAPPPEAKPAERDEILEMGAMLALVKLLAG